MASTKTLTYRMQLDNDEFRKKMSLSSKEINTLKRELDKTLTPAERAEKKLTELERIVKKGGKKLEMNSDALARLRNQHKQLQKPVEQSKQKMGGFTSSMKGMLAGGAIVVGVTKFFEGVKSGARMAAKFVGDLAGEFKELGSELKIMQRIGIGSEAFQGLQIMAGGDADAVGDIIKDMQVKIFEAATLDSGAAVDVLKILGLDAKALSALDVEDQFETVTEAIRKLNDEKAQAFVIDELFAGAGEKFGNSLRAQGNQFQIAKDQAKAYGVVLTDLEQKAIARTSQKLMELGLIGKGIWTQLAVAAGDAFGDMIEEVKMLGLEIINFVQNNGPALKALFEEAGRWVKSFAGWIDWLDSKMKGLLYTIEKTAQLLKLLPPNWFGPQRVALNAAQDVAREARLGIARQDRGGGAPALNGAARPAQPAGISARGMEVRRADEEMLAAKMGVKLGELSLAQQKEMTRLLNQLAMGRLNARRAGQVVEFEIVGGLQ